MSVSIVIVNYNAGDHVRLCLEALDTHAGGLDWDGIVVDNASSDGSEQIVERFDRVRLLRHERNLGFGRAVNRGVAATSAPLVLILNPDCQLLPGALRMLIDELDTRPTCAVVGPDVLNPDGTMQGSARGDPNMLTGLFGRSTLLTRIFPRFPFVRRNIRTPADVPVGQRSVAVDWVSGACMLVRRDAFLRVGGFDERYFLYWEDADLCRRIRAAGFSVRYLPAARVMHALGQSSKSAQRLAIREFHRSAYRYYCQHAATMPWSPARGFARVLLFLRCRWYLWKAKGVTVPQSPDNRE